MRKLLLSVFLCFAMVMGLLPTATFALELGCPLVGGKGSDFRIEGTGR